MAPKWFDHWTTWAWPVFQKTSHLWLAITLTHMNGFWYFFGRNVTDKVGNQKMLYYATSNNLSFCTTWQNRETRKSHFSLSWTVLHAQCTCALSSWKKKLSSEMCLIVSNICWDSKISPLTLFNVHWLLLQAWWRTTPIFYRATNTMTNLVNTEHVVTDSRMLCYLPRSCLVHPFDRFDSKGWFSSDQVMFLTVFCVFRWTSMQHLRGKMKFPSFLFLQVVQKHY